jgi:hypothetical protein
VPHVNVELQTLPGFAQNLDVGSLLYGLIIHERAVWNGTDTCEQVSFLPFLDGNGARIEIPGVTQDLARMAEERGEETPLDMTLVRSTALRLDVGDARPFGRATLQRAFVAVLAGAAKLSPKVGLTLHVRIGESRQTVACTDTGGAPFRAWSNAEWDKERLMAPPGAINDLPSYLAQLQADADRVVADHEQKQEREREHVRQKAREAERDLERARAREAQERAAREELERSRRAAAAPPKVTPPSPPLLPPPAPSERRWSPVFVTLMLAAYWWPKPGASGAPAVRAPSPGPASAPRPEPPLVRLQIPDPAIPTGNTPVPLETLYQFGFEEHQEATNRVLAAARSGDLVAFDEASAWLREHQPKPTWLDGEKAARREFLDSVAAMINAAKTANDRKGLEKAVQLSEKFLLVHYGLATAHMNLSIALSAMDKGKQALPPAFHAIIFDPRGVNPYVALGLALARTNEIDNAAAAFCSGLRRARYSDKTVGYFAKIANGEELVYPGVADAMRRTDTVCPRERWAVDFPKLP